MFDMWFSILKWIFHTGLFILFFIASLERNDGNHKIRWNELFLNKNIHIYHYF